MSRFSLLWSLLIALCIASALFVASRLQRAPELPVTLGPDLRVRAVETQQELGRDVFRRDDRLVALRGRAVENLRELRDALGNIEDAPAAAAPPGDGAGEDVRVVSYQIVRPLHRFNLLLQGEPLDPAALPPGVEQGDKLVELDGRPMKPKVGTEGLRSIISSRPEALLVLERRDAVFSGELALPLDERPEELLVGFFASLLVILAMWGFHHPSLSRWTPLATGVETLTFAWSAIAALEYQWLLADYALAYVVIAALVLARPLGIFARTASAEDGGQRKWGSLALGVIGAVFVVGALAGGKIPDVETALQFAAVLAGLFVIFEVVLTGLNEGSGVLLGERSVYLAGLLLFILFASIVAYSVEPVLFREDRWRWFAAIVLALVWFGDVLLCFRGLPTTPFAEIASPQVRRERVELFLDEIAELYPQVEPSLALARGDEVFLFAREEGEVALSRADASMADAIAILLQEKARVPAALGMEAGSDPMLGIADTMGIGLAMILMPPYQGLEAADVEVVLLGLKRDEAPPIPVEELDFAQQRVGAGVWAASIIEVLVEMIDAAPAPRRVAEVSAAPELEEQPEEPEVTPEDEALEQLARQEEVVEELRREQALLRRDRLELAGQVQALLRWYNPAPPLPARFDELLEQELLDALAFLCEEPAPIALVGPRGAGKTFIASAAHMLEQRAPAPCILYDASTWMPEDHAANLLGELSEEQIAAGEEPSPAFDACAHGTLVIQRAGWLPPALITPLCDRALTRGVRVYLCFDEPDVSRSPLSGLDEEALAILGERELVIPPLCERAALLASLLRHYLDELAIEHQRDLSDVSPAAMKALSSYDWPGNVDELITTLDVAIRRSRGDFLELGDLPLDVRRGTF